MTVIYKSKFRRFNLTPWRDLLRGRVTGRLDWKLIIADSQLPKPIQNCIFYVVKKTRLWRLERADVANELIAHFNDALESGEEVYSLVGQFGGQEMAAKLIRRAKLRQRPLPWQLYRWGYRSLIALSVVMMVYMGVGLFFTLEVPDSKTNYLAQVNQNIASVPADQRAWPLYRQALLEMGCGPKDLKPPALTIEVNDNDNESGYSMLASKKKNELLGKTFPGDEHWPIVRQFLKDHASSIELIRQASLRQTMGCKMGTYTNKDMPLFGREWMISNRYPYRELRSNVIFSTMYVPTVGKLLIADLHRAVEENESQTVIDNVDAYLRCVDQFTDLPLLAVSYDALRMESTLCHALAQVLGEHAELFSDQQLKYLAHRIAAVNIVDYIDSSGERLHFYDLVQRMYTDDGNGDGRITLKGLKRLRKEYRYRRLHPEYHQDQVFILSDDNFDSVAMLPVAIATMASRQEVIAKYDRMADSVEALLHVPLHTNPTSGVLAKYQKLLNDPSFKTRYLVLSMRWSVLYNMRSVIERAQAVHEGLLLGLALESYHRMHGRYPKSLDELSPAFIPVLPIDRITGEALKYKIIDNRPVIYSVGEDRDDDGGLMPYDQLDKPSVGQVTNWHRSPEEATNGDWVIWPLNNPPRLE